VCGVPTGDRARDRISGERAAERDRFQTERAIRVDRRGCGGGTACFDADWFVAHWCNSQKIIREPLIKRASPLESCPAASCGHLIGKKDQPHFHRRQGQNISAIVIDAAPRVTGVLREVWIFTFPDQVTMRNTKRYSRKTNVAQNNSA
jgi:hypothetical protein